MGKGGNDPYDQPKSYGVAPFGVHLLSLYIQLDKRCQYQDKRPGIGGGAGRPVGVGDAPALIENTDGRNKDQYGDCPHNYCQSNGKPVGLCKVADVGIGVDERHIAGGNQGHKIRLAFGLDQP